MAENMTQTEALAWLAELFEADADEVTPEKKYGEIEGWDSLGMLTLMAEFDEKFNILLNEEQLEAITQIQDILDIMQTHNCLNEH